MASQLPTIVIPTRNRIDFLELCLRSVFERQDIVPNVVVSDNSSADLRGMETLRSKYPFSYVRQSGKLSMTDHHNACLALASTPWAFLLHDDDELYPNILGKLQSFLSRCDGVGIVVGGIQYIDQQGTARGVWVPDTNGIIKGEEAVLRLGLDFKTSPPGWVWNVKVFHQAGGFPDAHGIAADYPLVLKLAYSHGVALFSEIVGRYRSGVQQASDYSTREGAEATLGCSIRMAQLTRTIGCSARVAEQLEDYMIWWIFSIVASRWLQSHPFFVSRLCRKSSLAAPQNGPWKNRIREQYPVLFWRPQWVWLPLYKLAASYLPTFVRRKLSVGMRGLLRSIA